MSEIYSSSRYSKESIEFNEVKFNNPDVLNINKFMSDINKENKKDKSNISAKITNKNNEFFSEVNENPPHISLDIKNNINVIPTEKRIIKIEEDKKSEKRESLNSSSSRNNSLSKFKIFIMSHFPNIGQSFSSNNSNSNSYRYNSGNNKKVKYCIICNEALTDEEMKNNLLECRHFFCDDCYYEFIKEKINSNFIEGIKCPDKSCETKLFDDFIENKLSKDIPLLEKYLKLKKKRQLMLDPNIQLCPFPDCDSYAKKESNSNYVSCIKYHHKFCFNCLKDWHGKKKCENKLDKSFENWRDSDNVKRCPKCKYFIEKNEGCNHITCVNCRYQFCWLCLGEYTSSHYDLGRCTGLQYTNSAICSNRFINFLYQALLVLGKCILFSVGCPFFIIFLIYYQFYREFYRRYSDCGKVFFGLSGILSCLNLIMCLIPISSFISILMLFYWPLQEKILSLIR